MTRETIYAALFDKLSASASFVTSSRILRHWDDVNPREQPALFQTQTGENPTQVKGMPVKWTLNVDIHIYANRGSDKTAIPSQKINELIDAIETALLPDVDGFQTLGGLVSHCWINGKIQTSEGLLGAQEVAIIPIEMYLYNSARG